MNHPSASKNLTDFLVSILPSSTSTTWVVTKQESATTATLFHIFILGGSLCHDNAHLLSYQFLQFLIVIVIVIVIIAFIIIFITAYLRQIWVPDFGFLALVTLITSLASILLRFLLPVSGIVNKTNLIILVLIQILNMNAIVIVAI